MTAGPTAHGHTRVALLAGLMETKQGSLTGRQVGPCPECELPAALH